MIDPSLVTKTDSTIYSFLSDPTVAQELAYCSNHLPASWAVQLMLICIYDHNLHLYNHESHKLFILMQVGLYVHAGILSATGVQMKDGSRVNHGSPAEW